MSAFRAYNIDYDSSDSEVDDTKELQIEDALKLYQAAIKYHSEGPQSYEKAAKAYSELFQSDVFKYTESLSEFRRAETLPEYEELLQQSFDPTSQPLIAPADNAPNTLPQIIHLSYKNHGQLLLDILRHRVLKSASELGSGQEPNLSLADSVRTPLNYFAEALDKDEADLNLWRLSSSIALLAESIRIARFCLEAVLDGDSAGVEGVLDSLGIDEMIARQQLRELSTELQDDLSGFLSPLDNSRRQALSSTLKALIDPYSDMKRRPFEAMAYSTLGNIGKDPNKYIVSSQNDDWASVGRTILQQLEYEQAGKVDFGPGASLGFKARSVKLKDATSAKLLSDPELLKVESPSEGASQERNKVEATTESPACDKPAEGPAVSEQEKEIDSANTQETGEGQGLQPSLPTRKRSVESAGLPEVPEGVRVRSKRIRARETLNNAIDGIAVDNQKDTSSNQLLEQYLSADQQLFDSVGPLLSRLHANHLLPPQTLRDAVKEDQAEAETQVPYLIALRDSYDMMQKYNPAKTALLLDKTISEKADIGSRRAGLAAFLGHESSSRSRVADRPPLPLDLGLADWVRKVNSAWLSTKDVAWQWLYALIAPGAALDDEARSSYQSFLWPDDLKSTVLDVIVKADGYLFGRAQEKLQSALKWLSGSQPDTESFNRAAMIDDVVEMIQTLYELHLDAYTTTTSSSNRSDMDSPEAHRSRLNHWSTLAGSCVALRAKLAGNDDLDDMSVRYVWASVMQISLDDTVSQNHILDCMKDLKSLQSKFGRVVYLPNSSLMPELSEDAADQKLRRMNMTDFFLKIFDDDDSDPASIIECIEPLLERSQLGVTAAANKQITTPIPGDEAEQHGGAAGQHPPSEETLDISEFIRSSSTSLRIALWRRLRDAYDTIEYVPKVVSCDLRIFEMLIAELRSPGFESLDPQQRQSNLIRWLRHLDISITHVLSLRDSKENYLDCVDSEHLETTISALTDYINILHAARVFEDFVHTGQLPSPSTETRAHSYSTMVNKLNDIELRAWVLLFYLLREGMSQSPELFPSPSQDRLKFLQTVHHAAGVRGMCSAARKLFLKLAKDELFDLKDVDNATNELCQVLHDLFGLKCALRPGDLVDHGCGEPELLGRRDTLKLLVFLLSQVKSFPIKDLPKTDLKASIDKVHSTLTRPKATETTLMNRRICMAYIKGPVRPMNLYGCVKGTLSLSTKPLAEGETPIASCGWYFLMGNLALNRFRSQKRVAAGPTEDLDSATTFFIHDLEYSTEQWETWYRLGQAYDSQLEECISWTAEKLNSPSNEIATLQRCTINCYVMAISCVVRHEIDEKQPSLSDQIGELYSELGTRLYASSREPFSMKAFQVRENEERHYNRSIADNTFMYRAPPFTPMKLSNVWKISAYLFREAIARKPQHWINHYMLGKCLWKILSTQTPGDQQQRTLSSMLGSFEAAIKALPARDSRRDPILEPHYKLVSVVHKLVSRGIIQLAEACEALKATPYATKVETPADSEAWDEYVIPILKNLRSADKAGWHHRMTVRAAQILYDGTGKDKFGALGAKHELTQQMFTKTMALQVWKPEFERPGRHFVYTSRYVRMFIEILDKTNDNQNYDALIRKVRKKQNDYFDHKGLWQEAYFGYIDLLRRLGKIQEGREEVVFKSLNYEEFVQRAAALERWCTLLPPENKALEILREAVDIKKVNSSFIKSGPNDDLIVDAYCQLYMEITPTLELDVKQEDGAGGEDRGKGPQNAPDQATKSRVKGVGRRELLRKAEAAGINPALVSPQILALRQSMAAERDKLDSASSSTGAVAPSNSDAPDEAEPAASTNQEDGSEKNDDAAQVDRFYDIGDDDESELSELSDMQSLDDERQVVKTVSRSSSRARSEASAVSSDGQDSPAPRGEVDSNEGTDQRLSSREVKTPSDDEIADEAMADAADAVEAKSPSREAKR